MDFPIGANMLPQAGGGPDILSQMMQAWQAGQGRTMTPPVMPAVPQRVVPNFMLAPGGGFNNGVGLNPGGGGGPGDRQAPQVPQRQWADLPGFLSHIPGPLGMVMKVVDQHIRSGSGGGGGANRGATDSHGQVRGGGTGSAGGGLTAGGPR